LTQTIVVFFFLVTAANANNFFSTHLMLIDFFEKRSVCTKTKTYLCAQLEVN